jgi:hypothetical protein
MHRSRIVSFWGLWGRMHAGDSVSSVSLRHSWLVVGIPRVFTCSSLCICVQISPLYKESSRKMRTCPNDLILIWLPLERACLHTTPLSEVGARTSALLVWIDIIQPTTKDVILGIGGRTSRVWTVCALLFLKLGMGTFCNHDSSNKQRNWAGLTTCSCPRWCYAWYERLSKPMY